MAELGKYGVAKTILFPLVDRGTLDFESTPVTHASGDTQISKDEGAFANTTNAFAHEGNGIYSLALTATEMQAARIVVTVIDSATKTWEDQAIIIETYGNASGEHAFDLDTATQSVNVSQISGDSTAADNLEADYDGTGYNKSNSTIGTTTTNTDMLTAANVWSHTSAAVASVPALGTDDMQAVLEWLAAVAGHLQKQTQTSSTYTLRNAADSADVGTATVSDDGTTFSFGATS